MLILRYNACMPTPLRMLQCYSTHKSSELCALAPVRGMVCAPSAQLVYRQKWPATQYRPVTENSICPGHMNRRRARPSCLHIIPSCASGGERGFRFKTRRFMMLPPGS